MLLRYLCTIKYSSAYLNITVLFSQVKLHTYARPSMDLASTSSIRAILPLLFLSSVVWDSKTTSLNDEEAISKCTSGRCKRHSSLTFELFL